MTTFFIIAGIVFYVIMIFVDIESTTSYDFKYHEGGFMNMGYSTCKHRDPTPHDVRMALIWPIRFIICVVKMILSLIHDILAYVILLFGYDYFKTVTYKKIDNLFDM